jgi:hypothetical protein
MGRMAEREPIRLSIPIARRIRAAPRYRSRSCVGGTDRETAKHARTLTRRRGPSRNTDLDDLTCSAGLTTRYPSRSSPSSASVASTTMRPLPGPRGTRSPGAQAGVAAWNGPRSSPPRRSAATAGRCGVGFRYPQRLTRAMSVWLEDGNPTRVLVPGLAGHIRAIAAV